jgi:hypothetical protein
MRLDRIIAEPPSFRRNQAGLLNGENAKFSGSAPTYRDDIALNAAGLVWSCERDTAHR